MIRRKQSKNKGSISLEYVLFVSAAVVLVAAIGTFYSEIAAFFNNVAIPGGANFNGNNTTP